VAVVTLPAVTENVVEVEPCGIVTLAGTFAADGAALTPMETPPLGAADVSATVQVDPEDGEIVLGLHERLPKVAAWRILTVPPLAVVDSAAPVESADMPFVSWMVEEESVVEGANVRVTEARTLFGMLEEFKPQTKQVAVPVPLVQESVLFAAPAPAEMVADVKSAVE
jgi:hypothetical protein